jgi:hypothetical protein
MLPSIRLIAATFLCGFVVVFAGLRIAASLNDMHEGLPVMAAHAAPIQATPTADPDMRRSQSVVPVLYDMRFVASGSAFTPTLASLTPAAPPLDITPPAIEKVVRQEMPAPAGLPTAPSREDSSIATTEAAPAAPVSNDLPPAIQNEPAAQPPEVAPPRTEALPVAPSPSTSVQPAAAPAAGPETSGASQHDSSFQVAKIEPDDQPAAAEPDPTSAAPASPEPPDEQPTAETTSPATTVDMPMPPARPKQPSHAKPRPHSPTKVAAPVRKKNIRLAHRSPPAKSTTDTFGAFPGFNTTPSAKPFGTTP